MQRICSHEIRRGVISAPAAVAEALAPLLDFGCTCPFISPAKPSATKPWRSRESGALQTQRASDAWKRFSRLATAISILCLTATLARADGGSVQLQSAAGPFQVTVFSEPGVIRAGLVDLSALVQTSPKGDPILDADVTLGLAPLDDTKTNQRAAWAPPACINDSGQELTRIKANRSQGPNRLLYSTLVRIPTEGRWQLSVMVRRKNTIGMTQTVLIVEPPTAPWTNYWHLFAFPPVAIIGFLLRQKILRRHSG